MRTILLAILAACALAWGGYNAWRAERALAIGHELAGIASAQQTVIEAAGQIARIMDNGADQCAAVGQEPVAICFRFEGGKVTEAKGVCSNNPRASGAARNGTD